jgi:predicted nuclease with TOPRIM domain
MTFQLCFFSLTVAMMTSDSPTSEMEDLRSKLEALTASQYQREEQFDQAIALRDAELHRLSSVESDLLHLRHVLESLRVESTDAIQNWQLRLSETQQLLAHRDATIVELTDLLSTAHNRVDADLRSISEYSVECPKCRDVAASSPASQGFRQHNQELQQKQEEVATLQTALAASEAERSALLATLNEKEKHTREILATMDNLQISKEKAEASLNDLAAENSRLAQKVQELECHVVQPISLLGPIADDQAEQVAANARRVAHALAQYCNLLTDKLRTFRKPDKRQTPAIAVRNVAPAPRSSSANSSLRSPQKPPVVSTKPASGWDVEDGSPGWGGASGKKDEEDLFSMLN